jgi:hypothetical protein
MSQQVQQSLPDLTVRPIFPSYLSNWLDHLGAYDTWEGQDEALDMMRILYESDAYYPYMVLNFNAGETQTGSFQVPSGSWFVSAGCYVNEGTNVVSKTGAGAKVRVYDKATQSDLFYQQFAMGKCVFDDGDNRSPTTMDSPFGPYLVRSPFIISSPGVIQWEITNIDANNAATIQVLLSFAVPKGSISGNVVVQEQTS